MHSPKKPAGFINETAEVFLRYIITPLTPNIKEQILLSCPGSHFSFKHVRTGEKLRVLIKISRKFTLGDHILIDADHC